MIPTTDSKLIDWSDQHTSAFDQTVFTARHHLAEQAVFTNDNLADLLDRYPRENLGVNTMGLDVTQRHEWREGVVGDQSGRELLEIVEHGRLWLNLRKVGDNVPEVGHLVDQLYDQMEREMPGFHASNRNSNLLISSPSTLVYYHCDTPANILWHVRGRKRAWVYEPKPPFLNQETVEKVILGRHAEEIPYQTRFDDEAAICDLEPGQVVFWPHHSPHRVTNMEGLNVSLSTEHMTRSATRRNNVHMANNLLRQLFGSRDYSVAQTGLIPTVKEAMIRVARRLPIYGEDATRGFRYDKTFVVDGDQPDGIRWTDEDAKLPGHSTASAPSEAEVV